MADPWQRRVEIGDATLYLGDCLDILPLLPKVDAVVTDPPYGLDFAYESYSDTEENWYALMNRVVSLLRQSAPFVIMPCCANRRLGWWYRTHDPEWVVIWHKGSPGHAAKVGFSDYEMHVCWGRPSRPMHDHFSTACGFDNSGHPCPKPAAYCNWLTSRCAQRGETILDPFMGSGTMGSAAVQQGRKFIGIEIEPKYFDIACERIDNAYRQQRMFA